MVALFLGFAKRRAELYALSGEPRTTGACWNIYQPVLLDKMIVVTATCVILTYSLYTMSPVTMQNHHTESLIYTAPFVVYGIFRYIYTLHHQQTGTEPAERNISRSAYPALDWRVVDRDFVVTLRPLNGRRKPEP